MTTAAQPASTPPDARPVAQVRLESERRLGIVVTSLIAVPIVMWAITDRALVRDPVKLTALYSLRLGMLFMYAAGIVAFRRSTERSQVRQTAYAISVGMVLFIIAISWLRPADNYMPLRTMLLVSLGLFVGYPNTLRHQMIPWLILAAGTVAMLWWHYTDMSAVERYSSLTNFLLAGVLGMLISNNRRALDDDLDVSLEREQRAIEARERSAAALRTLEGIIPICSYCHEVRTEAGAWKRLDHYVRERTEADFSHGMCPKCTAEHYPALPSRTKTQTE